MQLQEIHKYDLCDKCLKRQGFIRVDTKTKDSCYICNGLMDKIEDIVNEITPQLEEYQYDTMNVGTTLHYRFYEKEDQIRAKFKIKGKRTIKAEFAEIFKKLIKEKTSKKINFRNPDLHLKVIVDKNCSTTIDINTKSILIYGRYKKIIRGLGQKSTDSNNSIEHILSKELANLSKCKRLNFSWIGSEDKNSLVLGKGRPFYVKLLDPKTRSFPNRINLDNYGLRFYLRKANNMHLNRRFTLSARIMIECDNNLHIKDISKLKQLAKKKIYFHIGNKRLSKILYSIRIKKDGDNRMIVSILAEGGFLIKKFIEGHNNEDFLSVSSLLNYKCHCILYDILDITF